ncbi:uncharacterized protein LOC131593401 isoform X2 [Vicia villosa]|uniref:uncharacterized protein LOC131593401 isoform X2 n=1 Tax=Vicia villosa TaxID=3911 RepID=UPI00273A883B|nr:uncharacterized protein LOC131593401 isoform X2 [Vicia villosa]
MESCLADLGKGCVEKLINGALAELRHVFCFTCTANEFKEKKIWLEAKIKTMEQHAKVAAGNDKDIEADYHLWKEKAEKLVQEDTQTKQKCFFGLCHDCIWRYKKGKELANNIEEIKQLTEKGGTFENIEISRRLPDVERYSSKEYISFPSRDSKYKEILDAIKDDNNYMIVLQGMGGTGKTTLAKEVGKELKSEEFAHVIDTTVSFTPDTKKIQDDIAGSLGLKWEDCTYSDRAKKLWSRLTTDEKVLIIMDDVWEGGPPLDFELIGIPKQDNHKGCKVLITTRSKRISNIMGCDKMIELDLLPEEEAWTMFKMYAGINNNSSKSLIATGREIAKECKQLPVAIAVIAKSLKGQQDRKHKWDTTLKLLKETVSMDDVDEEKVGIYKCLKLSYDLIMYEKSKILFLLASLFPEDKEIPIEILTRIGIGTGIFGKNYGSYNDARNQVGVAKDKLIDSCLLVGVDEKHVKMHDLVREAAQWIAYKEIRHVNLSNKDEKSSVEMEKNMKYLFCEGKDMDLSSWKYDCSKIETLILDVERDEDRRCMEVPKYFLENIDQLQVLYFSGHDKRPLSLPYSIHSLSKIRSILVDGVDLGDISVFGNLQSLETLDLVDCKINELPDEIAKLGKFKLLNLEYCQIQRNDPFEVIKRCKTLEELYFIDSFNEFCQEITLPELQRYHIRKGWTMLPDSLSKYVSFKKFDGNKYVFSKQTFKYLMQTTEGLQLEEIKMGWRNLMPEIVPIDQDMKDLIELRLRRISKLQCLIDTNGSQFLNVLSNLVMLELDEMENLEVLFHGSLSFDYSLKNLEKVSIKECKKLQILFNCKLNLCNLKTLSLSDCPLMVNLFPLLTSQSLVLLEEFKIADCKGLKNIVIDDGDNNDMSHGAMYPKLSFLSIVSCDQLESIFPFLSFEDFPVLEVINIKKCDKLQYIFGQYQHVELNSLKEIKLGELPNFMGICPEYSHSMSSLKNESSSTSRDGSKAQTQVDPIKCNILSLSCLCCHGNNYRKKSGSKSTTKVPSVNEDPMQNNSSESISSSHHLQIWERAQCFPVLPHIMCNVKELKLSGLLKIKSVFILSITPRMLVETLTIENCDELRHIILDIGDDDNVGKNLRNVFPKLKKLYVNDCMQLEYIFGHYTDDHLPELEGVTLSHLPKFVAMCPQQYCLTFPPLKQLELSECPLVAIKSIGEFIINLSDSKSLDNTIMKELSGSIEHSFALQNLTEIKIKGCEKLEIIFSNSFSTCLPQLCDLTIENCKDLKHIIVDDTSNSLSSMTVFPMLKRLVVLKCHKLKCVFPISICKELSRLEVLMIIEADELEEIFKSNGDQKVEIPNLNLLVFAHLPSLFDTQGIHFMLVKFRLVRNCQKLRCLTSSLVSILVARYYLQDPQIFSYLFHRTGNENPSAETTKDSVGIKIEATFGDELTSSQKLEAEQSTSQQDSINQQHPLGEIDTAIKPSQCLKETNHQNIQEDYMSEKTGAATKYSISEITNEPPIQLVSPNKLKGVEEWAALRNAKTITTSTNLELVDSSQMSEQDVDVRYSLETTKVNDDQDFQNSEHVESQFQKLEDTGNENSSAETTKDVVVGVGTEVEVPLGHKLSSSQIITKQTPQADHELAENVSNLEIPSVAVLPTSSKELEKEQPPSEQRLIKQQDPHGEIDTTIKPLQDDEEETALTKDPRIAVSTHSEVVSSSQERDVGVRDSLETTTINGDQVPLNEDVVLKASSTIEEEFPKGDEFIVLKSKPSPRDNDPLPLAFQAPSLHFEGNPSKKVEDLGYPYLVTRELEELVSKKHVNHENLPLLTDFFVKHPSVLLRDISISNRYKGYAYNCLAELLKFLQIHCVWDVLGSSHSEFVELLQDVRRCGFDKYWLDGVEKHALFSDLQFSQDALQNVLDSKKQFTNDVEVLRFKIDILTQNMEDLKQQLSISEANLERVIQQEKEIVESKAALSAPLGY